MERAGLRVPRSAAVKSMREAERALPEVGLPAIVRPGFTMGGQGGGIALHRDRSTGRCVAEGLAASPIGQVLVEESVIGWGEFELEVMRDRNDNVVIVCSIENIDPMGVHTGDSVTVAPAADPLRHALPGAARPGDHRDPRGGRRDRRLEHPVRGQPGDRRDRRDRDEPARVALVGAGVEGHRLPDRQDRRAAGGGLRARGDRQRHHAGRRRPASSRRSTTWWSSGRGSRSRSSRAPTAQLHTSMQSVGEAMAIGRTFKQAFVKAMRSRELDVMPAARRRTTTCSSGSRRPRTTATRCSSRRSARGRAEEEICGARASTPGSWPRWRRWRAARTRRRGSSGASRRWTPAPPSSRPRRPTTTRAGSARAAHEVRRGDRAERW